MTTKFSVETIQTVIDNVHLVRSHWDEIVKDSRKLEPAWDFFRKAEKVGGLKVFVARDNDGVVGYAVFMLQWHLHSLSTLTAHNDAVFVREDKRKSGDGYRLLKFCDEELSKLGVKMILWHIKPAVDFSPTLQKMGYSLHESIWCRFVGE